MPRSRRWVLTRGLAGTALAAAGLSPFAALAQAGGQGSHSLFGLRVPDEVAGLLPQQAQDVLAIAEGVMALEREADLKNLPRSALQQARGMALPTLLDELYAAALPRLVALVDRASLGRRDGGLGDRAAELLARLHSGEHEVPEALQPRRGEQASASVSPARTGQARLWPAQFTPEETLVTISEPVVQDLPQPPDRPEAEITIDGEVELSKPGAPSRSLRFDDLADEYRTWFDALSLRPERREAAEWHLTMLRQSRRRYEAVSARTQVPWYFVGATHGLEASFNFRGHLHNGDFPLTQRTRQVPAGRPTVWLPPSDWESSAIDALRMMGFAGQSDWSLARTLHRLEAYNGFGYRRRGAVTPYLWSFSDLYDRGKFVSDGRFSPTARSQQCGAAVMLKLLVEAGDASFA
jgi:lysozyme family protein